MAHQQFELAIEILAEAVCRAVHVPIRNERTNAKTDRLFRHEQSTDHRVAIEIEAERRLTGCDDMAAWLGGNDGVGRFSNGLLVWQEQGHANESGTGVASSVSRARVRRHVQASSAAAPRANIAREDGSGTGTAARMKWLPTSVSILASETPSRSKSRLASVNRSK